MIAKTTRAYGQILGCIPLLLQGVVVAIDPSIGSNSSMPGWAVYSSGSYVSSGTFQIEVVSSLPPRLQQLARALRELYRQYRPDVLVYEDIPPQRYGGGGNANAHASLIKSVGAILSVAGPTSYVGIHPVTWKKMVNADYVKSDRGDAEAIGYVAIRIAKEIYETEEKNKKRAKKKSISQTFTDENID